MPGATFTQDGRRSSASTNGHGGVQPSTSKTRPAAGAAGGVGEGHVEAGRCRRVGRVGHLHGAAEAERGEVGARPPRRAAGRGRRRRTVEPGPRERDQVAADAAAEVEHRRRRRPPRAGRRGARRPGQPGGLLEAVGGEVHPGGVVAELRHRRGAAARPGSAPRRRVRPASRVGAAQRGRRAHAGRRRRRRPRAARASSAWPASVSSQPEGVEVHAAHPVRRRTDRRWHSLGSEC